MPEKEAVHGNAAAPKTPMACSANAFQKARISASMAQGRIVIDPPMKQHAVSDNEGSLRTFAEEDTNARFETSLSFAVAVSCSRVANRPAFCTDCGRKRRNRSHTWRPNFGAASFLIARTAHGLSLVCGVVSPVHFPEQNSCVICIFLQLRVRRRLTSYARTPPVPAPVA